VIWSEGTHDLPARPPEIARANPIARAVPKAVAMPAAVSSPMPSDRETAPPVAAGDELLGISRRTLVARVADLGISRPRDL